MNKFFEMLFDLRVKWYRWRIIRAWKRENLKDIEREKVMEQFATNRILVGDNPDARNNSRNVLMKHQQTIRIKQDFQDFLNTL